jgi:transposase
LKNRIQATLCKYGLQMTGVSDPYGRKGREALQGLLQHLPPQTTFVTTLLLQQLDLLQPQIDQMEQRLQELLKITPQMQWVMSLPGIGLILAAVIALEVGDVHRFPSAMHLASYSGTTPRVHSSGDKTRYGRLRPDVNRYLKWAFVEAANCISLHHTRQPERHVSRLYKRIRDRKGHPKAIGAVARHLAEATFHVLNRKESYREPIHRSGVSKGGVSATAA